jgi:selenocysteine lyase/cysteine desulfurase
VKALGVDAYVTGGLKWLLGGPGVAYLYVRRELHDTLAPTATGWFAHKDQFKFDAGGFVRHVDARRFETGTPALPSVYAGNAGLGIIEKLTPHAIRARTNELGRDLYERLQDAGYQLATPQKEDERAGIIMVCDLNHAKTVATLRERYDIIVDHRPGRVRVSPYFYNTLGENEKFVDALRDVSPPTP